MHKLDNVRTDASVNADYTDEEVEVKKLDGEEKREGRGAKGEGERGESQ